MKIMTLVGEEAPTNLVPAVAVIRGEQALFRMIWCKEFVDGGFRLLVKDYVYCLEILIKLCYLSRIEVNRILYIGVKSNYLQRNASSEGDFLGFLLTLRNESVGSKRDLRPR
jgi:hypothetical protein